MRSIRVELILEPPIDPRAIVGGLAKLTQVRSSFTLTDMDKGEKLIDTLTVLGHTSLLEPLQFAVVIHGASRIFLSQITRHRQASYVSQSQQYQDQSCFPYVILPELEHDNDDLAIAYHEFMTASERLYRLMKASGIPQDQARYVVPGAARNDLFIDANAREWIEVIFPQRLCRRNTHETQLVMSKVLALFEVNYAYLFKYAGPPCLTSGECDQGSRGCGKPFTTFDELLEKGSK